MDRCAVDRGARSHRGAEPQGPGGTQLTDSAARAAFARYVRDRRGHGVPGYRVDRCAGHVRLTPLVDGEDGFVAYTRLKPGTEACEIDETIAYFDALGTSFEWKVYAYDEPADLAVRLGERGFVAGEPETFMLCRLADLRPAVVPQDANRDVRRVTSPDGIDAIVALQETIHGESFGWLAIQLKRTQSDASATLSIFAAVAGDTLIGAGWTEYPEGSAFPELHGGGVLAAWRRRGVYASLFAARVAEARSRGYADLAVDASSASRPILERVGFVPICSTWPMRWSRGER